MHELCQVTFSVFNQGEERDFRNISEQVKDPIIFLFALSQFWEGCLILDPVQVYLIIQVPELLQFLDGISSLDLGYGSQ